MITMTKMMITRIPMMMPISPLFTAILLSLLRPAQPQVEPLGRLEFTS
jgi:hypothetical protein